MEMNAAGSVYDTSTSPPLVSQGATGPISGGILRPGSIDQGAFLQALAEAQENREAAGVGGKPVGMPVPAFQANIPTLTSAQFAALVGAQAADPSFAAPDDGAAAGERAEGGEHAERARQVEARQPQRVAGRGQAHDRVLVAGEHVAPGGRPGVVGQPERPLVEPARHEVEAERGGQPRDAAVVVADHQAQGGRRRAAEALEPIDHRVGHATAVVDQVPEHGHPGRAGRGEEGEQAREVPVEDVRRFRALKPDLEVAIFDPSGSLPHDEHAREFNRLVMQFAASDAGDVVDAGEAGDAGG